MQHGVRHIGGDAARFLGVHPLVEELKAHGSAGAVGAHLIFHAIGGHGLKHHAGIDAGIRHGSTLGVINPHLLHAVHVAADDLRDLGRHGAGRSIGGAKLFSLQRSLYVTGPQTDGFRAGDVVQGQGGNAGGSVLRVDGGGSRFGAVEQPLAAGIVGIHINSASTVEHAHTSAVQTAGGHSVDLAGTNLQVMVDAIFQKNFRKVAAGGDGLSENLAGH